MTSLFLGFQILDGLHIVVRAGTRALLLLDVGPLDHEPSFAGAKDAFLAPGLPGQFVSDGLRLVSAWPRHVINLLLSEPHVPACERGKTGSQLAIVAQLLDIIKWHVHFTFLRPGEPVDSGAKVLVLGRRLDQLEVTAIVQCHVLTWARAASVLISV